VFALPVDLPGADPLAHPKVTEHLTEVGVIVALMGAGLKIDRPLSRKGWASTWRLLATAMPLTIAAVALPGRWWTGLVPAAALLLGGALAPTDPVLASDVQVGELTDQEDSEDEVRFALTSEAGLNDGLAFPCQLKPLTWQAVRAGSSVRVRVARVVPRPGSRRRRHGGPPVPSRRRRRSRRRPGCG
jgi:NhaP-type Na+/H+ or K+/H+ antiporter